MTLSKRSATFLFAAVVGLAGLTVSDKISMPTVNDKFSMLTVISFVSVAEAVVGRPLSPVSVAGVARRDARRSY
jgi:hypothetical protein